MGKTNNTDSPNNKKKIIYTPQEQAELELQRKRFEYEYKKERIKCEKRREKQVLESIRNKYRKPKNKIPTTKKLIVFILINCSIIEIYSMIMIWVFQDGSVLQTLISSVIAEAFAFLTYCLKSYFENKSEKENELNKYMFDNNPNYNGDSENIDNS